VLRTFTTGLDVDRPRLRTIATRVGDGATVPVHFRAAMPVSGLGTWNALRGELGKGEPAEAAEEYFGVGQTWKTGIASFDGKVPAPADETELAASVTGQGRVPANPLVTASVAATAVAGSFHQPTRTRAAADEDAADEPSATDLPDEVSARLRELLRGTVTDGTASVPAGLPGEVGARTGECRGLRRLPNNGRLIAYRGDVAVACVVQKGATGKASAGPVVRKLLESTPHDPS
jgi:cell division protein FtsI/penicillin-binding protein 2